MTLTVCPVQVASSLGSEGKNWDDYILVSQDGDLQPADGGGGRAAVERTPPIRRGRGLVRMEPEGAVGTFHDPLMAGTTSGSSSPDEGSTHSKDSDFTIVNPNDLWASRTALPPLLLCDISFRGRAPLKKNWLGIRGRNRPEQLLAKNIAHVDCDTSSHKYLILCLFTCHLCHLSPVWADAVCYLINLMPVSLLCWVLSHIIINCSTLLHGERAPLNFWPCHYMISLTSWTSNCNFHMRGGLAPLELTVMIVGVMLCSLNVEIWPYLCLCSVCVSVLTEEALVTDSQRKRRTMSSHQSSRAALPLLNQCLWPLFFFSQPNKT